MSSDAGHDRDERRARVATAGLTGDAVAALTPAVRGLPLDALGPVKQLLKRYFSDAPWSAADDDALADAVGEGGESRADGRAVLAPDLVLEWSWTAGRFGLRLGSEPAP
jgi:hypothetical protein